MSPATIMIGVGLLVGAALVPGAPIFALPIVAVLIVLLGVGDAEPIEFTERDKQTLAE